MLKIGLRVMGMGMAREGEWRGDYWLGEEGEETYQEFPTILFPFDSASR